jgi:hypothetical protein
MNAGKIDTTAEVMMDTHDMACLEEVCAPDHIRTLTKSFGVAVDSATSLGYYYSLCRSPCTARSTSRLSERIVTTSGSEDQGAP